MSTKINVRSPYFLHYDDSSIATVDLILYINTGSSPASTQRYLISKQEIEASSNYIMFEISELIRDYIDTDFDGTYDNEPVWVRAYASIKASNGTEFDTDTQDFLAFEGYTYIWEGSNQQLSRTKLFTNSTVWRPPGVSTVLPFFSEDISTIAFSKNGSSVGSTVTITDSSDTASKIQYVTIPSNSIDTITITKTDTSTETVAVRNMDCSKYTPIKITFYNKYGALQDLYFFAKHKKSLSVSGDSYKSNLITANTFGFTVNPNRHQNQIIDRQGKEKIMVSTGFVSEDYNEPIKELMLSEKAWVTEGGNVIPVNITSTEMQFRTSLNDKKVEYDIEFEYAVDAIQNIR